ncbi:MAG: PAS domain S-box protein [Bacteroidales bacterium]
MDYSTFTKQQLIARLLEADKQLKDLRGNDKILDRLIKSEERYIDLYDNSPDMFFSVDTRGKVLSVNKTGAEQLGYTKDELVGKLVWPVVHKDDLKFVKQKIAEIVKTKSLRSELEFRKVRKDGSELFVHERTQLLFGPQGKITEIRINCRDITARKVIQDALLKEEEKYRTLTENLNIGIYRTSPQKNGHFIEVNPALLKMFGYKTKDDLFTHNVSDLYMNPQEREDFFNIISKKGFVKNKELKLKRASGQVFTAEVSTVIVRDGNGKPLFYDGIVEDISERRNAEESMREKEKQYQTLFSLSPSGIMIEDEKGIILDVNPAFCDLLGYKAKELLGKRVHMLSHPEAIEQVDKNLKLILAGERLKHIEKSITKDGTPIFVELNERIFSLPNGKTGIICIAENITQRLNAENQLKLEHNKSERLRKFNEALFSATPYPIFYKDSEGRYLGCNNAFTEQLGFRSEEIKGKTVHQLWPSEMADIYHQKDLELLKNKRKQVYEWKIVDKNGEPRQVIYNKDVFYDEVGNVAGLVGAYMDITDRIQAENALRESEAKYRLLVENITDLIVKIDPNGKFLYVSPSYCELFGKRKKNFSDVNLCHRFMRPTRWLLKKH